MIARALAIALAAACGSLSACSDEPITCRQVAEATCRRLSDCLPFAKRLRYRDDASCVADHEVTCKGLACVPGSGATSGALKQCMADLPGLSCEAFLASAFGGTNGTGEPLCGIQGGLPRGSRCLSHWQCAQSGSACADGVCAPADRSRQPREGESCSSPYGASCAPTLYCDCDQTRIGCDGVCKRHENDAQVGATCTWGQFASTCGDFERTGLFCRDGVCAQAAIAEPGADCRSPTGGVCGFGSTCGTSTCAPPPKGGEPCSGACEAPTRCVGSGVSARCVLPDVSACPY